MILSVASSASAWLPPHDGNEQIADRVLSLLKALAIFDECGTAWRTLPENLGAERRNQFPSGVIDVGVAHGVPGVIGLLAMFVDASIQHARSSHPLRAAVSWLLDTLPPGGAALRLDLARVCGRIPAYWLVLR